MIDPAGSHDEFELRLAVPVRGGVWLDSGDLAADWPETDVVEPRRSLFEGMDQLIDELGLGHIRANMGYALSGGERRRVEIARALCIAPKFILLDEPFSGIDPIAVLDLQKIIFDLKANGIGVLVTDHNVRETLSVTDRAYIINEGRIFRSGTPEQLGNDADVKRVYLGESFSFV